MTPLKILVEGFLSYRDEQVASFEGGSVWMLAGRNGAGKSSLFDAMTVALFNEHRNGAQQHDSLINTHRDGFRIEFDYLLGDQRYQARRIKRRKSPITFQMRQWIVDERTPDGRWQDIAGTDSQKGFNAWVERNIGLSYKAFTTSVLLLQGKAENLITAKATERRTLLSQIVNAERFNEVQQKTASRRKKAEETFSEIKGKLDLIGEVTAEQLTVAQAGCIAAQQAQAAAEQRVADLQTTYTLAEHWDHRRLRLAALDAETQRDAALLADAAAIERDAARLAEVALQLPALDAWLAARQRVAERGAARDRLEQQHLAQQADQATLDARLAQLDAKLAVEAKLIDAARQAEQTALGVARAAGDAVSVLKRWQRSVQDLGRRNDDAQQWTEQAADINSQHAAARAAAPSPESLNAADQAQVAAKQTRDEAATLLQQAANQKTRFESLKDAELCSTCRQPLTAAHRAAELTRLNETLAERTAARDAAEVAWRGASQQHAGLRERHEAASRQLSELEQRRTKITAQIESARELAKQAAAHCRSEYRNLADDRRLALASDEPTDWRPLAAQAGALLIEWQTEATQAQQTAAEQGRTQTEATLRHNRLKADWDAASATRRANERRLAEAVEKLFQAKAELTNAEHVAETSRQALLPELQAAGESAAATRVRELQSERDQLQARDAGGRLERLRDAQNRGSQIAAERAVLERQQAETPAAARRDPQAVAHERAQATQQRDAAQAAWAAAHAEQNRISVALETRERLSLESTQVEQLLQRCKKLESLVGKEGLLLWVVRQAEAVIVELADEILDGFSNGELRVELRPGGDDAKEEAFQLDVRTKTSDAPLDPNYLSGSQKFRLAVSMALAIGRYASRNRRPIRAVVIDEGFGCLDTENRRAAIEQLRTLQDQLDRIILVSHQEEFYDAFPHGYVCEMSEDGTRLREYHRR